MLVLWIFVSSFDTVCSKELDICLFACVVTPKTSQKRRYCVVLYTETDDLEAISKLLNLVEEALHV